MKMGEQISALGEKLSGKNPGRILWF